MFLTKIFILYVIFLEIFMIWCVLIEEMINRRENIRLSFMSTSFNATPRKRLATSPIASNPPCTKKILLSSTIKSPSRIPKVSPNIKRSVSRSAISQSPFTRRPITAQESKNPIVRKFPCVNYKRLATSPIASNPPCTKKILLSSTIKSPSRIPKVSTNIKRSVSSPAIFQSPVTRRPITTQEFVSVRKYPCLNCKCCEYIKQMQPYLLEIYRRQKNISKRLSNANIGVQTKSPSKYQRNAKM